MFYLYSSLVPDAAALHALHSAAPADVNVALIMNARDYHPKGTRLDRLHTETNNIKAVGYTHITEIDLRNYSHQPAAFTEVLASYQILWIAGGNTFVLRQIMAESGLDAALPSLLEHGLIYVGGSAAAVVLGPSLAGIELADDITLVGHPFKVGLNLIDHVVLPHADDAQYGPIIARVDKILRDKGFKTTLLNESGFEILPYTPPVE